MTGYKVFVYTDQDSWAQIGPDVVSARSAKAAIREVLDSRPTEYDRYVAVPVRSWRPVTVKTETKTALKFS